MSHAFVRGRASWLLAATVLSFASCGEAPTPPPAGEALVGISAVLTPEQQSQIAGMSVEVTGPGIGTPIVVNLDVAGASVNGTVEVPVGASRTFTVRAFDANGVETHVGSATAAVQSGTNPPLAIRLVAHEGNGPIDVTIGSYGVTLSPPTASVAVDGEVTLTASVAAAGGGAPPAGPLTWGVLNPTLVTLTVAADGRSATVRGKLAGSTRVVAVYEGIAAASEVTITGGATNQRPVVNPGGPYFGLTDQHVTVTATATDPDGTIRHYVWSNGSGTSIGGPSATFLWSTPGTYWVKVFAVDDGDLASAVESTTVTISTPPVGNLQATQVVAGEAHSCALTAGVAYCWGAGTKGQLGNGARATSARPVRVTMPAGVTFSALQAGADFTCGITTGTPYCWGANDWGQLGVGDFEPRDVPTAVPGINTGANLLAVGAYHVCSRFQSSCWGRNDSQQIDATATMRYASPVSVGNVIGGIFVQTATAGERHSCWNGQVPSSTPVTWRTVCVGAGAATTVSWSGTTSLQFPSMTSGRDYSCGRMSNGQLWCWGNNASGQFGTGGTSASTNPVLFEWAPGWTPTAFGAAHTCGRNSTTTAACAGSNSHGQLGNGSTAASSATPVVISGGNYASFGAGVRHTCGIRAGSSPGNVYCWGDNASGQLGDGTTTLSRVPVPVGAPAQ